MTDRPADPKIPNTMRMVLGILPTDFPASDAPAMIALAATTMALVAASTKQDMEMIHKLFDNAVETFQRMPEGSRDRLFSVANELVDCMQSGKKFMVMGGFERDRSSNGEQEPEQASDAAKRPNVVGNA